MGRPGVNYGVLAARSTPQRVLGLVVSALVVPLEETIWRGFAITRLQRIGAPLWLAVVLPSLAFRLLPRRNARHDGNLSRGSDRSSRVVTRVYPHALTRVADPAALQLERAVPVVDPNPGVTRAGRYATGLRHGARTTSPVASCQRYRRAVRAIAATRSNCARMVPPVVPPEVSRMRSCR